MLKTVHVPALGHHVAFGRRRPVAPVPHLKFKNYLRAGLPSAPSKWDYTTNAAVTPIIKDIMLNDKLGDCGIAGYFHIKGIETGNAGKPFHATAAQIKALYAAVGHYVDGDPSTDNGIILTDLLNRVMHFPDVTGGTQIAGYAAVDATNPAEVMSAIYIFGGSLYMGLELPDSYPNISGDGFLWDVGTPDPEQGHCVVSGSYDSTDTKHAGIDALTWGFKGRFTFPALAELCVAKTGGECWVLLTHDQLAAGYTKAPNGIAWDNLLYDLNSIGGNAPLPPPPTPAPAPPVSGGVSLAMAEAAVKKAFANQPWLISSGSATTTAMKALEALSGWTK